MADYTESNADILGPASCFAEPPHEPRKRALSARIWSFWDPSAGLAGVLGGYCITNFITKNHP